MKTIFIFSILTLQFTIPLLAKPWVPVKLITHGQDTLAGYVKYPGWKTNPSRISFKKLLTDNQSVEYTYSQISKILVVDRIYVGAIVDTEQSTYETQYLTKGSDYQLRKDTVFLLTLIGGPKSLYLYRDQEGKDHFYIRVGDTYSLLLYKRYLDDNNRVKEAINYKWQLTEYLDECPSVVINLRQYSRSSLDKIFREYYACSAGVMDTRNTARTFNAKAGMIAGATMSKLDFESDYIIYLNYPDFKSSVNPAAGMYLDLYFSSRSDTRLTVYQSMMYTSFQTHGSYLEVLNPQWTIDHEVNLEFSYLKLMHLLHYRFHLPKNTLILGAGVTNALLLDNTLSRTEHTVFQSTEHTIERVVLVKNDIRTYEFGFVGKVAVQRGSFSFGLCYEISNGMSEYKTLSSTIKRYSLLIGYAF